MIMILHPSSRTKNSFTQLAASYAVTLALLMQGVSSQTCTTSHGKHCTAMGKNSIMCNKGQAPAGLTVKKCDLVNCTADASCKEASITNATNVKCGKDGSIFSCLLASIKNVSNLECSGNAGCARANIMDVPKGGNITCDSGQYFGLTGACEEANITSTQPFTLTCQGNHYKACRSRSWYQLPVTNPGGSVFCHGGVGNSQGACSGLQISDSASCVICGSRTACSNGVRLVDQNGITTKTLPDNQVAVSGCTELQIVEYLNKVHSRSPCDDADNDGVCDVVQTYCNGNDACTSKFSATWAQQAAQEFPNEQTNKDRLGRESLLVGVIVIGSFIILMMWALLYFGRKNQWSWWKNICGNKSQTQDEKSQDIGMVDGVPHQEDKEASDHHTQPNAGSENDNASNEETGEHHV